MLAAENLTWLMNGKLVEGGEVMQENLEKPQKSMNKNFQKDKYEVVITVCM